MSAMRTWACVHDDLDGYGCSTVIGLTTVDPSITHVSRYSDIVPILKALRRDALDDAAEAGQLVVADLGLDGETLGELLAYAAMNASRGRRGLPAHRVVVLDHHASSIDAMRGHHSTVDGVRGPSFALLEADGVATWRDDDVTILVDTSRCASALCLREAARYATVEAMDALTLIELGTLVEHVEAVDLWRRDSPLFAMGMAFVDFFDEVRRTIVPDTHPGHDRFMSGLLMVAAAESDGRTAAGFEAESGRLRLAAVDRFLAGDPLDDRGETTRYRTSRAIARDGGLYRRVETPHGAVMACFNVDVGIFQRTSTMMMDAADPATCGTYVDFYRGGGISFRSIDGGARRMARMLGGGGHADAAGATLPGGSVFSLEDALSRFLSALAPDD